VKTLESNENDLVGSWIQGKDGLKVDQISERILWLIATNLHKVADSPKSGAWETLYRDPADGRLWERTYPNGETQGGGPPRLRNITAVEAREKYGTTAT
jgi:hypothetical protein